MVLLIVAVFDIDGVVIDSSKRSEKCLEEQGVSSLKDLDKHGRQIFWKCLLSDKYMDLDEPIIENIRYLQKLKEKGVKIILLTGRREDAQKTATLSQLDKWKIPYDEIFFRRKKDFRKDFIYKASITKLLLKRKYEISEIWEDSKEVATKLKEITPNTKIILYDPNTKQNKYYNF